MAWQLPSFTLLSWQVARTRKALLVEGAKWLTTGRVEAKRHYNIIFVDTT